jgi:hypothetical protein
LGVLTLAGGLLGCRVTSADDSLRILVESEAGSLEVKSTTGRLEILRGSQKLLVYACATNQFKPYVKELYTLTGENLLRDAPADHLHHHGLMYAIRVNGTNFWEERQDPGHQKPVQHLSYQFVERPGGVSRAAFTQRLHWVAHQHRGLSDTSPVALLLEERTLTLTVDEAAQEVALEWQANFEVGRAVATVSLGGANYHGLGLRLPAEFDRAARHQNSEGLPYSPEQRGDVTPAKWSSVSHTLQGHPVLVALFSHPSNPGESRFFTMLDAFAYLSATQNLEKAPLTCKTGDQFRLRYLLVAYSAARDRQFLAERYQRWLRSTDAGAP